MKKRLKINGAIMTCMIILMAFFPRFFFREYSGNPWEEALEVLGFGLIFLGQIIRVSARGYKSEHSCKSQSLIQGGPYKIVRNPMYLGILLIGIGVVIAIFKWWALIVCILLFVFRYVMLMRKEEKILVEKFSDSYRQYCKKVPRIFPSWKILVGNDIREYLPMKLKWIKKEAGTILILLLCVLLIESWEEISSNGISAYLQHSFWIFLAFTLFLIFVATLSKETAH